MKIYLKRILQSVKYSVLFGIPILLCSFLYLLHDPSAGYIPFLKKLLLGYGALWLVLTLLELIRKRSFLDSRGVKIILRTLYGTVLAVSLLLFLGIVASRQIGYTSDYQIVSPFFRDKQVMVIVPHQDDEINLTGGILEQYTQNGSHVTLVFATNGDKNGLVDQRTQEALKVAASVGIATEDVYYLGYGDQWQAQEQNGTVIQHIYNSTDADAVWTSAHGSTHTYGSAYKNCYAENDYTRNNFVRNLTDLIMLQRPDVIFCVDYDSHIDHKALDLFFEECMGQILRESGDYQPIVWKGFCYGTAWFAEDDFRDSLNILSTKQPDSRTWDETGTCYRWDDRVRLPVSNRNLGRILSETGVYQTLASYRTQYAFSHGANVINGDKVFWERRTDSLLYGAAFFADQEQIFLWNDFKLKDSFELSLQAAPSDGIRGAACIDVIPNAPITMDSIWLYDNPSLTDNILSGYLEFENGFRVDFGPLNSDGSPTKIVFQELSTESFRIHITQTEGTLPGLAEIEAYHGDWYAQTTAPQILMAVDQDDNFVYDYWYDEEEYADFSLYTYPHNDTVRWETLSIKLESDPQCHWEQLENGLLRITCPKGLQAKMTISSGTDTVTTFTVSNPGSATKWITTALREFDYRYSRAVDFFHSYFALKIGHILE